LNVTQWNTLKTKMNNYITAYNAVQSAVGEWHADYQSHPSPIRSSERLYP
jgi:hypothetical protein